MVKVSILRLRSIFCLILFLFCNFCFAAQSLTLTYRIYGVNDKPKQNVEQRLLAVQKQLDEPLSPSQIQILFQNGPKNILSALQPYGYFRAQVVHSELQHEDKRWVANYWINPGMPLRITQLTITVVGPGKNDPEIQKFLQKFPLKIGQVLKTTRYNNTKDALVNIANMSGYLDNQFTTHVIAIDLQNYTASITLVFDTGPRYYFGPIQFSSTPYDEAFLRRYLSFKQGDPYSDDELITLQNNLSSSVYFQNVNVVANRNNANGQQIPVYVNLVPRKSQQYSMGLGYGTDTGVRGSLGWEWRRVTSSGDYMQAMLQASQIQNNFQARYVIPGANPVSQRYEIFAGVTTNQPGDGNYTTYQTGGSYITDLGAWTRTLSVSYQHEIFNLGPGYSNTITDYLVPSVTFQNITADDQVNTRNGYRIWINTQGGTGINLKSNFLQTEVQAKYIKTLGHKNRIVLRTDLGFTAVRNLNLFPLSLRFFAGGSQSVRGYDYQGLGPGKSIIVGSAEYQREIHGKWYGTVFYDAGNAFNGSPELEQSTGLGIMYQTPMGPIEITVARPLTNVQGTSILKALRVQLVIGPDL